MEHEHFRNYIEFRLCGLSFFWVLGFSSLDFEVELFMTFRMYGLLLGFVPDASCRFMEKGIFIDLRAVRST